MQAREAAVIEQCCEVTRREEKREPSHIYLSTEQCSAGMSVIPAHLTLLFHFIYLRVLAVVVVVDGSAVCAGLHVAFMHDPVIVALPPCFITNNMRDDE